jgi:hypothetical protein
VIVLETSRNHKFLSKKAKHAADIGWDNDGNHILNAFRMDQDPLHCLQWLWDRVNHFQAKFNDLCKRAASRALQNFERPFDVALHVDCGLKNSQTHMTSLPCSCCKGALTVDEARP